MNRKELINLIVGMGLIVLFFMGFTEITDSLQANPTLARWQQFDLYADHAHVEPTLSSTTQWGNRVVISK